MHSVVYSAQKRKLIHVEFCNLFPCACDFHGIEVDENQNSMNCLNTHALCERVERVEGFF